MPRSPSRYFALLSVLAFVACGPKYVHLAENRPAYTREEGRNLRRAVFAAREPNRDSLRAIADTYLGIPYLWGGEGQGGIDCSAFSQQVMRKTYGLELPRTAALQSGHGVFVFRYGLQVGDLLFFGPSPEVIDHVGIYMGGGMFINATSSSGVKYSNIDESYWREKYQFARRVVF